MLKRFKKIYKENKLNLIGIKINKELLISLSDLLNKDCGCSGVRYNIDQIPFMIDSGIENNKIIFVYSDIEKEFIL